MVHVKFAPEIMDNAKRTGYGTTSDGPGLSSSLTPRYPNGNTGPPVQFSKQPKTVEVPQFIFAVAFRIKKNESAFSVVDGIAP